MAKKRGFNFKLWIPILIIFLIIAGVLFFFATKQEGLSDVGGPVVTSTFLVGDAVESTIYQTNFDMVGGSRNNACGNTHSDDIIFGVNTFKFDDVLTGQNDFPDSTDNLQLGVSFPAIPSIEVKAIQDACSDNARGAFVEVEDLGSTCSVQKEAGWVGTFREDQVSMLCDFRVRLRAFDNSIDRNPVKVNFEGITNGDVSVEVFKTGFEPTIEAQAGVVAGDLALAPGSQFEEILTDAEVETPGIVDVVEITLEESSNPEDNAIAENPTFDDAASEAKKQPVGDVVDDVNDTEEEGPGEEPPERKINFVFLAILLVGVLGLIVLIWVLFRRR